MMKKKATRNLDGLTLREALFARLYIINRGNARKAAEDAGYTGKYLRSNASHLLDNPRVAAVIQREGLRLVQKLEVKAERVLQELCKIAFADIRTMFRPDGTLIPISVMDADAAANISSIVVRKGGVRVRFHSKLKALDLLGQHLKLWDGATDSAKDRLDEVLRAFQEGPAKPETIQ